MSFSEIANFTSILVAVLLPISYVLFEDLEGKARNRLGENGTHWSNIELSKMFPFEAPAQGELPTTLSKVAKAQLQKTIIKSLKSKGKTVPKLSQSTVQGLV